MTIYYQVTFNAGDCVNCGSEDVELFDVVDIQTLKTIDTVCEKCMEDSE